jgi:hypothetical protein
LNRGTLFLFWYSPVIAVIAADVEPILGEVGEVQNRLNQKLSSKSLRAVDFALRFVLLIKFKFKIHTFNSYYQSQYKINGSQKL